MPPVASGHVSYWVWGPPERDGLAILVGVEPDQARARCAEALLAARIEHPFHFRREDGVPVTLCRGHQGVAKMWPELRRGF
jgi:hypothetical protein